MTTATDRATPCRALFAPRFPRPARADAGALVVAVWLLLGWATLTVTAAFRPTANPTDGRPPATDVADARACTLEARC